MAISKRRSRAATAAFTLLAAATVVSYPSMASASTPKCKGKVATIVGTEGDDVLTGTSGDDVIVSLGGNDLIDAGKGNDIVCSGDGDDEVSGGPGDDEVRSGAGNDFVSGGRGDDRIFGGIGDDRLLGGNGKDRIFGGKGADSLNGELGNDRVYGQSGNDSLGNNSDDFQEFAGNDFLAGGPGADHIVGSTGSNKMFGGPGNDKLTMANHAYAKPQLMRGGGGDDRIEGAGGNDELRGNGGDDYILGRGGEDLIVVNGGTNTVFSGEHGDRIIFGKGHHKITAGSFDQVFPLTNSKAARVTATLITDATASPGSGPSLVGGNGPDHVTVDTGFSNYEWTFVNTRGGDDVIEATSSYGDYWGGPGSDTITSTGGASWCGGGRFFNNVLAKTVTISPQEPTDNVTCSNNFPNGTSWTYGDLVVDGSTESNLLPTDRHVASRGPTRSSTVSDI